MRRIFFAIIITGIFIFLSAPVKAQLSVSVGINIGSQPVWGPVGYDNVQYYYLPDIDVYYYVPGHLYYYQSRGGWKSSPNLPHRYRNYDLYGGYKVVLNEDRPYLHDQDYRVKYASYKNRHDQAVIRDSHDAKYSAVQNRNGHKNEAHQQRHVSKPAAKQNINNNRDHGNKEIQDNKRDQR